MVSLRNSTIIAGLLFITPPMAILELVLVQNYPRNWGISRRNSSLAQLRSWRILSTRGVPIQNQFESFSKYTMTCSTNHCTVGNLGHSRSQLYEHLFSSFWSSCSHPATVHTLHISDLDLWFNFTPFWCKNHFCSIKIEGVTSIFLVTNIFSMTPCSVNVSPTVHCSLTDVSCNTKNIY